MVSGIRKKKRLGQHFLNNPETARRIAGFLRHRDHVVEIGPGAGMLTQFLVAQSNRVTVVEMDGELIPGLVRRFGEDVQIVQADALSVFQAPPDDWGPFSVASNLPYNISAPLTLACCRSVARIPEMVLMYQKEVADKITREPGALGLAVWPFFEAREAMTLKPGSFSPPPKVLSTVLRLVRRPDPLVKPEDSWFRFCRRVFENRRKMLVRNLMKQGKEDISLIFRTLGIDERVRAHQLTYGQLVALYREWVRHDL